MATANGNGNGKGRGERIAIVSGLRTPFAKSQTAYRDLSALDLGKIVVAELLARAELSPKEVGLCVYGQVLPSISAPNIAREIVLGTAMPKDIQAFSVSRACATSFQSLTSAAEALLAGQHDVAITGGADSASDVPITVSKKLAAALLDANKAKTFGEKLKAFRKLSPGDFLPVPPSLKEPTTGLTMGESAEKMAKEAHISREEQDVFAHRSHSRAAQAWKDGLFAEEVMHVVPAPRYDKPIARDNSVREESSLDAYAKLKPAFDRKFGSITAGNSSPLTDGASALLVMTEQKAKALGYKPLGYLRSWAYAALDPEGWMLMGPSYATPIALDRAGLSLSQMDIVDMHEAFAAQVLCNVQAFSSKKFAEEKLGRSEPIGAIDDAKFNVHGGSISIGHPFAATGARMVTTVLRELKRRGGQFGLATACAAGGLGAAVVLEVGE
ncbi:acetyl-CoA C-acyltransferase FadI [Pendulispora albinea]|uniref:Acetyl-CoA C-acyltransferase FadI n=1 Tax=Pendulispora albinea TaxID=2741071 RepID=A0ABZ2LU03_9BACT